MLKRTSLNAWGKEEKLVFFQGKAFQHPLTEQGQQPHFLRNTAKGIVQDQRCNDQQRTGTFASPLQQ